MMLFDAWALWLIVPLFVLFAVAHVVLPLIAKRRTSALAFSHTGLLGRLRRSPAETLRRVVELSRVATLLLLAIALTRPVVVERYAKDTTRGIDMVLALDTSGSMRALDLDSGKPVTARRTRLEIVKDVVEAFVQRRPNDQIGVVVFGTEAYVQCPLTLDHGIVTTLVKGLEIGVAGDTTAIGSGIGTAVNRLKKSQAKSKVIVLLTDGVNNSGKLSPKTAAEIARTFGIKIYTIGAGSRGEAPFIVDHPFFGKQVGYDKVEIDEEALKEVAATTGGAYFRAEDVKGLAAIYDRIDALEKTELKPPQPLDMRERASLFIVPALVLLLLEVVLLGTRLQRIP